MRQTTTAKVRLDAGDLSVLVPRSSQLIGSTLAGHVVRDLPLPTTGEGALLGPITIPNPGNVG